MDKFLAHTTAMVGRMPFMGRHFIRPFARESLRESNIVAKTTSSLGLTAFLGCAGYRHIQCAALGVEALQRDADSTYTSSLGQAAEMVFETGYTTLNGLVVLAQAYIGYRVLKNLVGRVTSAENRPSPVICPEDSHARTAVEATTVTATNVMREVWTNPIFYRDSLITLAGHAAFAAAAADVLSGS